MKKQTLINYLYFFIFITATGCYCNTSIISNQHVDTLSHSNINMVGNDRDLHGCIPSAGYQWSELQQQCIRSFELPLKLLNQAKTFGAYVCFSADSSKAEVFSNEGNWILVKNTTKEFVKMNNDSVEVKLNKNNKTWLLYISLGDILYKEEI